MKQTKYAKVVSLVLGFTGILLCVLTVVLLCLHSEKLFIRAEVYFGQYAAVGMSETEATQFAEHTIAYLNNTTSDWSPDVPFAIPESFILHMSEVKRTVRLFDCVAVLGLLLYGVSLTVMMLQKKLNVKAYMMGFGISTGILLFIVLWAVIDFSRFWLILHRCFIRGGIFSAKEPIMQLFPAQLFYAYMPSLLWNLLLCGLLSIVVPVCLNVFVFKRR